MKRKYTTDAMHIVVLCNFAFAQPILNLLGSNVEFFLARQSEPVDILFMVGCLCFLLAFVIIMAEALIKLVSVVAYNIVHLLLLVVLGGFIFLPVLSKVLGLPGLIAIFAALAIAILFAIAVKRFKAVKMFLLFLSPAAIIFPVVFLFQTQVFHVVFPDREPLADVPQVDSSAPVILLVFDELAVVSLMTEDYLVDAVRFPNFAALMDGSNWFRNATSVSDDTVKGAVPAILTGNYPQESLAATGRRGEGNLFTMLAGAYEFEVNETNTQLCPRVLCPQKRKFKQRSYSLFSDLTLVYLHIALPEEITTRLPQISHDWKQFWPGTPQERKHQFLDQYGLADRDLTFQSFVASISSDDDPTFYFLHILLPHIPWIYLPSGEKYSELSGFFGVPGLRSSELWSDDTWAVTQGYQRYLLQLGYVDSLVGDLVAKLKAEGMYDSSLLIVTADHGVSFRPSSSRRQLTIENFLEVAHVPLFIKTPGQEKGVVSDRNVETIDVLPTIADVLEIPQNWKIDGISVFDMHSAERHSKTVYMQNRRTMTKQMVTPSLGVKALESIISNKIEMFGSDEFVGDLLTVGPYENLIGRKLVDLDISEQSSVAVYARVALDTPLVNQHAGFSLDSILPVSGILYFEKVMEAQRSAIAIAVGGMVAATTFPFFVNSRQAHFSAFMPGSFLASGTSDFTAYIVSGSSKNPKLQKLNGF